MPASLAAALAILAPAAVAAPPDARLAYSFQAKGVQVYQCIAAQPSGYGWSLVGPDAVLKDKDGRQVARHFAGPSWQAGDGSTLVGHVRAKAPSPDGAGVDWLLLDVAARSGQGLFGDVRYVRRLATVGGKPPAADDCSEASVGRQVSSPYTATYEFWR
jgi:hypothetical protein